MTETFVVLVRRGHTECVLVRDIYKTSVIASVCVYMVMCSAGVGSGEEEGIRKIWWIW